MGLAAKLNVAFITVITVVVGTHVGVQIFTERNLALQSVRSSLKSVSDDLAREASNIQQRNAAQADRLATDHDFTSAYGTGDHNGVAAAVKNYAAKTGMPGFAIVFDPTGKVFYSGDTPAKYGFMPDSDMVEQVRGVARDLKQFTGPGSPGAARDLCIIGMVPIKSSLGGGGAIAVCQPIDTAFLTGVHEKVRLTSNVQNAELLLYSLDDGRVTAMTPGLVSGDNGLVSALNHEGMRVLGDKSEFERGPRFWQIVLPIQDARQKKVALLLAAVNLPDQKKVMAEVGIEAAASVVAALLMAFLVAAILGSKHDRSVGFLVQRAKDLAAHKKNLPPLDSLGHEYRELAEVIDTAVSAPRISVKQLQNQMGKHQDELLEKQQLVEEAQSKIEAVNRQLSMQSRQLSEVSSQFNIVNTQAVVLQHKLSSVMQISTEGFLLLDPYGNVISANPAFLNWLGCMESDIAGHYCFDLVRKPDDSVENGHFGEFGMHVGEPGDLINHFFPEGVVYNRLEEKHVDVIIHLQPIMTDERTLQGYIMVLRDKTLHSEAARLRNEIASMLQDSIRTPLAVADQKWTRVLSGSKDQTGSHLSTTLVDLHLSYKQLLGVVDSLLMMHTGVVPTSPVVREQVSIARLIGECMERCVQRAREQQVMLDYKTMSGLPTTGVDEHLVRDSITQLIEKMITITAGGGRVRVETSAKSTEIRISFFSSGPALGRTEIDDMFAGFIQGKHDEDSYSDRLSMYLVRNNLERIGGPHLAESDRGTYIYVILPIQ